MRAGPGRPELVARYSRFPSRKRVLPASPGQEGFVEPSIRVFENRSRTAVLMVEPAAGQLSVEQEGENDKNEHETSEKERT